MLHCKRSVYTDLACFQSFMPQAILVLRRNKVLLALQEAVSKCARLSSFHTLILTHELRRTYWTDSQHTRFTATRSVLSKNTDPKLRRFPVQEGLHRIPSISKLKTELMCLLARPRALDASWSLLQSHNLSLRHQLPQRLLYRQVQIGDCHQAQLKAWNKPQGIIRSHAVHQLGSCH